MKSGRQQELKRAFQRPKSAQRKVCKDEFKFGKVRRVTRSFHTMKCRCDITAAEDNFCAAAKVTRMIYEICGRLDICTREKEIGNIKYCE